MPPLRGPDRPSDCYRDGMAMGLEFLSGEPVRSWNSACASSVTAQSAEPIEGIDDIQLRMAVSRGLIEFPGLRISLRRGGRDVSSDAVLLSARMRLHRARALNRGFAMPVRARALSSRGMPRPRESQRWEVVPQARTSTIR